MQVDLQLAIRIRRQLDALDQRAQQVRGFRPVLFGVQRLGQRRDLFAVVGGHVGMQEHRLFLRVGEQGLQFLPPGGDAGEVVLDLGRRHAVLDRLDQVLARFRQFAKFRLSRRPPRVLLAAQRVHVPGVLGAKFLAQRRVHQAVLERADDEPFQLVLPHGEPVLARALVAGRRAAIVQLGDLAEAATAAAALQQVGQQHPRTLLLMELGELAQDALPRLHLVPERLINDPQFRNILDDPFRFRVQA